MNVRSKLNEISVKRLKHSAVPLCLYSPKPVTFQQMKIK